MSISIRAFDQPGTLVMAGAVGAPQGDAEAGATGPELPVAPGEYAGPFLAQRNAIRPCYPAPVGTLTAAGVLRDCSFRRQSSLPERRACRTLMRQAALKWRQGLVMGD